MTVFDEIRAHGVVPVVVIDEVDRAVPLGEALLRGGLPCAEITFRTPVAAAAIDRLRSTLPDLLVGAGTVMSITDARMATDAGASFIMSPGFDEATVDWCVANSLALAPGIMTPTEVHRATNHGLGVLKFFPAELAGGVAMLQALSSVYPGIGFIPTGGIDEHNLARFLDDECVLACGG